MIALRVGLVLIALLPFACSPSERRGPAVSVPSSSPDPARPLPSPLPEIVARVNGEPIALQQILALTKVDLARVPEAEREARLPAVLRGALDKYVARELLAQEAIRRGITADARSVEWAYDQMHREHADEKEWASFLAAQGMDPGTLKVELRIRHMVAALIEDEVRRFPIDGAEIRAEYDANPSAFGTQPDGTPAPFESVRRQVEQSLRQRRQPQIVDALQARIRSKARIEIFL